MQPVPFRLSFPTDYPPNADIAELLKRYWASVGIEMEPDPVSPSLFESRISANAQDAVIDNYGEGMFYDILLEPNPYFPFGSDSLYAQPWGLWFVGTEGGGEEPPPAAKRQFDLYNRAMATVDEGVQTEVMKEIMRISKEEFYQLGLMLPTRGYAYGIVKNEFHNVPRSMISSPEYAEPGPT